jgi:hypothetical protein
MSPKAVTQQRKTRGKERLYADAALVPIGIGLHPDQAQRLQDLARDRGVSLSAVVRQALAEWELCIESAENPLGIGRYQGGFGGDTPAAGRDRADG